MYFIFVYCQEPLEIVIDYKYRNEMVSTKLPVHFVTNGAAVASNINVCFIFVKWLPVLSNSGGLQDMAFCIVL